LTSSPGRIEPTSDARRATALPGCSALANLSGGSNGAHVARYHLTHQCDFEAITDVPYSESRMRPQSTVPEFMNGVLPKRICAAVMNVQLCSWKSDYNAINRLAMKGLQAITINFLG
jgi:hypothetical protein